ncbi:copper chaperone PCu(A)C [Sphingorhabdus sp. Alg239-R122]|uniref:copper chaperone PCu(A)C n=1 Tax=Sphingorhabdus sp. Alg239-R122 TaxID=2305989 RepID=UPI001F072389|nr:copper chaperone PCu(A)C [Sphingorhabdus sp. Alg239-R122]
MNSKWFVAAVTGVALSACGPAQILGADDAIVKLSPIEGNPSAGYLTLRGGSEDTQLVEISSKQAERIELHETIKENGLSKMQSLENVDVPAGENVAFEPGGKHLMIWGVNKGAAQKGEIKLLVKFANGEIFRIPAKIEHMGTSQSMHDGMDHGEMDHGKNDNDNEAMTSDTGEQTTE